MKKKTNKQAFIECLKDYAELSVKDIAEISGINARSAATTATLLRKEGVIRITNKVTQGVGGPAYVYELTYDEVENRPTREVVYDDLLDNGPAKRRELIDRLGLKASVITTAIKALREMGLVDVIDTTYENGGATYTYQALKKKSRLNSGQMINRIVELGGGPFGLMAAQLGARP